MEHPRGGLRGYEGAPAYAEVTGYTIPWLQTWGEQDFAERLGRYLVIEQNADGAFQGWQMKSKLTFDTAMAFRGLQAVSRYHTADRSRAWLHQQVNAEKGYMHVSDKDMSTQVYTIKAAQTIGYTSPFWLKQFATGWPSVNKKERIHFIAYGMEGLRDFYFKGPEYDAVLEHLRTLDKPYAFWYRDDWTPEGQPCPVGNIQMSILLDDRELLDSVKFDGLAWTAKYLLEAHWHFEQK
jgi:hypothetical protein